MTTPRFLFGAGRGGYGLWMSKAGFNVRTCAETDLIFSSDAVDQNLLHIARGSVVVANGGTATVFFPAVPGGAKPSLRFIARNSALNYYEDMVAFDPFVNRKALVSNDNVIFTNNLGFSAIFTYVIFAKNRGF